MQSLLAHQDVFFSATPAAEKLRYAAAGQACGGVGYRTLRGKELYDYRPAPSAAAAGGDDATHPKVPSALAAPAPAAYAALAAAGRDLLAGLDAHPAARVATASADLGALCEAEGVAASSLLSLFRYEATAGGAAPHVDRGLLTLVACGDAGLQLREHASSTDGATTTTPADNNNDGDEDGDEEARWAALPPLRLGEVAVLVGATLAAATGNALRAAMHRVLPQPTPRLAAVLRMRGARQALLPRLTVAAFETLFAASRTSVNRDDHGFTAQPMSGASVAAGPSVAQAPRRRM